MIERETKPDNYDWQLSDLLNNIDIGIFSRDIQADKYLSLSDGCCKIYGYASEEFINNPKLWHEVIYPDDKHIVEAEFELLRNGQKSKSEYRIIHKTGAIRRIEIKVIPIFSEQKLVRVDGIVADITERKQAELQIIEAKGFSEIIMNSLSGIFYMYDVQGKFNYWNKNFETVTGYSSEEIKDLNPLDLFEEDEKELLLQRISLVFEQGSAEVEANLVTKKGVKVPFYFNGRKVSYDGEVRLVGMGIDITQRKKAEETLQKSEEMLSHILNSIPQSIFWKDTTSTFLGCNSVFAKEANLENAASIIGKTDFDFPWLGE
ncbi:MAG: PAS domain S-box protein, partial [Sphingobacteriaceae bacterium]